MEVEQILELRQEQEMEALAEKHYAEEELAEYLDAMYGGHPKEDELAEYLDAMYGEIPKEDNQNNND